MICNKTQKSKLLYYISNKVKSHKSISKNYHDIQRTSMKLNKLVTPVNSYLKNSSKNVKIILIIMLLERTYIGNRYTLKDILLIDLYLNETV